MKQVEHTNSERAVLEVVRHPFLVNLWGTFADPTFLYMVMDFVPGGELFTLLRKSQRFPHPVAKFYAAEVALAIDYLHQNGFVYRDLKPENILLSADGHLKITDFGFAKYVPDVTWTLCGESCPIPAVSGAEACPRICDLSSGRQAVPDAGPHRPHRANLTLCDTSAGTPDYLAPEIVSSKGYNKSVDWWALGVLLFEMLVSRFGSLIAMPGQRLRKPHPASRHYNLTRLRCASHATCRLGKSAASGCSASCSRWLTITRFLPSSILLFVVTRPSLPRTATRLSSTKRSSRAKCDTLRTSKQQRSELYALRRPALVLDGALLIAYAPLLRAADRDLLKNLLTADLTKRYGNLHQGAQDIFGHMWFAEVDWDRLYRREIPAPYLPTVTADGDASQFER